MLANTKNKASEEWESPGDRLTHDDPLLSCLLVLSKIFHLPATADALTAGLPLVENCLTPQLFIRAAERVSLSAKIIRRPLKEITNLVTPAVLLLKNQKACVLEKTDKGNTFHVILPESDKGVSELSHEDLEEQYTGLAIFIKPAYVFDNRTRESVIPRAHHWFWDTIKKSWPIYTEVLLASFLINVFALATPLFIMNVYDRVVPNNAIETLWVLAIGVMIIFAFDLCIRTLRGYFIDTAGKRTDIILSATLFERVLGIKMSARPPSVGAFANSLQEFESFRNFFTSATLSTLIDFPFILLFILVIAMIGGSLALVPLFVIPLALIAGLILQKPLGEAVQQMFRHSGQKNALLIESLNGIETIKCNSAESSIQRDWEKSVGFIARLSHRIQFLSSSATNITASLQQFATVAIVVWGVYKITEGDLTMGALIACTILTGRALAPLSQMAATLTRYHQARASLHSITSMMELPQERPDDRTFLHRSTFKGSIEFRNVRFCYPNQEIDALRNVSFKIKAGEKVGIIGRVGSGKSTIEKLIMGLYEPNEGSVLIGDADSRQLDPSELRRNIGYVPQDIMLFYGTIRDNITLGIPYADDSSILAAAQIAGVTSFANKHPSGLDLQVGERGENLSGGQRQCVAVARGLIGDPPIYLLDEPTNAMDSSTESAFKSKLTEIIENKTLILITHRASLLSLVDRIIIVEGGCIVADGPREQVIEALQQGRFKVDST